MSTPNDLDDLLHAIADPTRRRLLELLKDRDRPVADLLAAFRVSQPAVSQHLRVLRDAGAVRVKRSGRRRLYRADPAALSPVSEWLSRLHRRRKSR